MATKPLRDYQSKRDFKRTPEPSGDRAADSAHRLRFCVQKHAARHLHYDFRLEWQGVLKSWAIPKGPCLDPGVKRLAVQVEDHPLDYATFEGTIPKGNYGAGEVIVWDIGDWTPEGDVDAGWRKGHLRFTLHGEKLAGEWHLVRTHLPGKQPQWFLMKARDEQAISLEAGDILVDQPGSVLSGRSDAKPLSRSLSSVAKQVEITDSITESPRISPLPEWIAPELATLVTQPLPGQWHYEIKFDGYRLLTRIDGGQVQLLTRNGHDWTPKLLHLANALGQLKLKSAWLDGEIVWLDAQGKPDFQALQNAFEANGQDQVKYFLFDLLYLDGQDYREVAIQHRREVLRQLLERNEDDALRFSVDLEGPPQSLLDSACHMEMEGLIGKRAGSRYQSRRSGDWIKLKCQQRQEFVIVGYTQPNGSREHIGALLLGLYDAHDPSKLLYAGKVGSGLSVSMLQTLHQRLQSLHMDFSPLSDTPPAADVRGAQWVRPALACDVSYAQKTRTGVIRHGVFRGLREDKPIHCIVEERPVPESTPAAPQNGSLSDVRITHPERLIDPSINASKWELASYYDDHSQWLLGSLAKRPVSLVRGPEGIGGELFFQKHAAHLHMPDVRQLDPALDPGHAPLLVIDSAKGLIEAVQMGALEFHGWNATQNDLERPDRFVLDLDPDPSLPWQTVIEATQLTLTLLDELKLMGFLKTSGGKGMHILVPLQRRQGWDEVKRFSQAISQHLADLMPNRFSAKSGPKNRIGKIFVDYLRNGRGASTVLAYSVRAREGLPVSVPIFREELTDLRRSDQWNIRNLGQRLHDLNGVDPWEPYSRTRQSITATMRRQLGL